MSSGEAVQEVRRIFTNNTVEQVRGYLSTITRGIQESDDRLKHIVGQSYRDLIAACDQVVGMEQTCKRLLQLQKELHMEQQLTSSAPSSSQALLQVLELGSSSRCVGGTTSSEATPCRFPEEKNVDASAHANGTKAPSSAFCDRLIFQQRCIAIEGLLGAQQVQKAATVWHELRDGLEGETTFTVKSVTAMEESCNALVAHVRDKCQEQQRVLLESYGSRIRQAIRDLLRKDADNAARHTMDSAGGAKRTMRGVDGGSDMQRQATDAAVDNLAEGSEVMAAAMAHMTEAHAALGVLDAVAAPSALQQLIALVAAMIEGELQLISAAVAERMPSRRGRRGDAGAPVSAGNQSSGAVGWLRGILTLPVWLLDDEADSKAWRPPNTEATKWGNTVPLTAAATTTTATASNTGPTASGRFNGGTNSGAKETAIALHLLQRSQQLFFHLVAYAASVLPRLCGSERDVGNGATEPQDGAASAAAAAVENKGEDADRYVNYKRQQRSLQSLLTLRGRLLSQQQEEEDEASKESLELSGRVPKRMGGSVTRDVLSNSLRSAPEEAWEASVSASNALVPLTLSGGSSALKRSRLRTMYVREVMRQVCGMQLLDPQLLQRRQPAKQFSALDSGSSSERAASTWAEVGRSLTAVQATLSRLLGCVADAGLLRSPRFVAMQERLALQEATRLQQWLRQNRSQGAVLFDVARWTETVHNTTERALVKAVRTVLRKADVVWNATLQCIQMESCRPQHEPLPTPSQAPPPPACVDASAKARPMTLLQLSQRLLSRSLSVSQLIAAVHRSDGKRPASFVSSSALEERTRTPGEEGATTNALLARAVVQCMWSHSKAAVEGTTEGASQLYTRGGRSFTSDMLPAGGLSADLVAMTMSGSRRAMPLDAGDEMLFVDGAEAEEDEEVAKEEKEEGDTPNAKETEGNKLQAKKTAIVSSVISLYPAYLEAEMREGEDQVAVSERSVLLHMLQRIVDSEKLCAAAQTPVQSLITTWMSSALGRVQAMMQSATAEYQQPQQPLQQGESFERHAAMIVFFHRLSLLVDVLLRVLEVTPAVSAAGGTLVQELRETVIACHTPWVQLLRREWESGLCTAYREALAAVTVPTVDAVAPSLAARRYALEYAACWYRGSRHLEPQERSEENTVEAGGQAVAYPIQLTPHVAELLLTLQHILYTVSVGRRLHETVFPLVVRELLDGTAAAALNFVLPTLTSDRRTHMKGDVSIHGGGSGASDPQTLPLQPMTDYATDGGNRDGGTDGDGGVDDDEKEDALLQLYFDVRFITGLLTPPEAASVSSTAAVLRAIKQRVDPVTWSLASPLLISANEQLLRATTLSFGSWCAVAAADVWNAAGSDVNRTTANTRPSTLPLLNGAIATPTERERFPLLPLAATAPSLLPTAGGTSLTVKARGGIEGRGGATSSLGASASAFGRDMDAASPAPAVGGKGAGATSFTSSLLWGDGTKKGWMGSIW
ncbi:hypothetical protein TRSC58_06165 [Trypanosoma rangeli SC58]|uniref:Conserved oligomeric Golgi complex subunit 1 n=1 Tax=Trypanosoma rangeli SC58 TaxID=429131 RepID=A0A061IVQ7_TRYRA|nr:hypothetical protein TRSC58_06165 [Trypanosoma rangeli SC58]